MIKYTQFFFLAWISIFCFAVFHAHGGVFGHMPCQHHVLPLTVLCFLTPSFCLFFGRKYVHVIKFRLYHYSKRFKVSVMNILCDIINNMQFDNNYIQSN